MPALVILASGESDHITGAYFNANSTAPSPSQRKRYLPTPARWEARIPWPFC